MNAYTRGCTAALALLASWTVGSSPALAQAQKYPSHPVTIIVPFGAGGSADVYARVLAQRLGQETGQSFVVENRPGAGAVIGTQYVAKAAPDGYTLLMMSNTQTVNETLLKKRPYDLMQDFTAVAPVNEAPLVLVVRAGLPIKSVRELVAQARQAPGKLNYASSGTGTPYHMAGELFKSMAGVNIAHIPYKSSGGARTDVLGGQVDMMFDAVSTMTELIQTKKVLAVATTGTQRSNVLPDIPTMAEAGVPGYTATIWLGLLAPKGTPPDVVNYLNERISRIVEQPDIRSVWAQSGVTPMKMTPAQFTDFLKQDIEKWGAIVKSANITVD
ncbi:tripartite tricarboxylate transporter substrate binding protein [Bordetella sp. N]|uniref:Bug family tripartite tricarboxylate transporter substrate binding protein n=1 Tax=Bordetella sp. N TaxID=1746199 RepID=UPI00070D41D7|nr:tripartite tricarboxylate transporter substrate binding protein [Bordetella sp. N]ALM86568.1 MFS transporter [Bordetella sp. N]